MPQPLSNVCPSATVEFHFDRATSKPELTVLVSGVFARWAWIENQLSVLLLYILRADAKPAMAMFSVLNTHRLQQSALSAAAKSQLPTDQFDVFTAAMSVIDIVKSDRDRLAHWIWGSCPELQDFLLLANPSTMKAREIRREETLANIKNKLWLTPERLRDLYAPDTSQIFIYSKDDLERCKRDLGSAVGMLVMLRLYLNPYYPDDYPQDRLPRGVAVTRSGALDELLKLRLFREALDRAKGTKSNPEAHA